MTQVLLWDIKSLGSNISLVGVVLMVCDACLGSAHRPFDLALMSLVSIQ